MITSTLNKIKEQLARQVHIAPLVVFRILFGGVMLAGIIRFALNGWIYDLYIAPSFYFPYYGFEWVKPPGATGMYILFALTGLSAFTIMTGLFYRISAIVFFACFTYIELIDKSNYLNHYYFISIVAFLMIFLPAGRFFSIDTYHHPDKKITHIPRWFITSLQLQLGLVYFFAGFAKLNSDWLFEAQPLRTWLQPHTDLPIIGVFMDKVWVAYLFSWFGAIYDLSIPVFLSFRKTRGVAYLFVIAFHVLTRILFQIGMFPYIMILATLLFFSENFHLKILHSLMRIWPRFNSNSSAITTVSYSLPASMNRVLIAVFAIHFTLQVLIPFRYLLYPGNLFWTEQGYRFSWRVMLMEKAGKAFFYVTDKDTNRSGEVMNNDYLTPNQEKMMATQPDMIVQYAHFLAEKYHEQGIKNPAITVECYVTLNGSGSRLYIDRTTDLTTVEDNFRNKSWILPFDNK